MDDDRRIQVSLEDDAGSEGGVRNTAPAQDCRNPMRKAPQRRPRT